MNVIHLILADTGFLAIGEENGMFSVTATDTFEGKHNKATLTIEQVNALVCTMLLGDNTDSATYAKAEEAQSYFPSVRLIP